MSGGKREHPFIEICVHKQERTYRDNMKNKNQQRANSKEEHKLRWEKMQKQNSEKNDQKPVEVKEEKMHKRVHRHRFNKEERVIRNMEKKRPAKNTLSVVMEEKAPEQGEVEIQYENGKDDSSSESEKLLLKETQYKCEDAGTNVKKDGKYRNLYKITKVKKTVILKENKVDYKNVEGEEL